MLHRKSSFFNFVILLLQLVGVLPTSSLELIIRIIHHYEFLELMCKTTIDICGTYYVHITLDVEILPGVMMQALDSWLVGYYLFMSNHHM